MNKRIAFDKPKALITIAHYLEDGSESKELIYIIDKTLDVVLNRHYSAYRDLLPDFKSAVYTKIFKILHTYNPSRDIFTFLYSIIRNEVHNLLYHIGKDRFVIDVEDIDELSDNGEMDELSIQKGIDDQEVQEFIDSCFPITRYFLGENLMDYIQTLHELNAIVVSDGLSLFNDEESIHKFSIFASLYQKSDAFLQLFAYYKLFSGRENFGAMLVALASIKSRLPNVRIIKKIVDEYTLLLKYQRSIDKGVIVEALLPLELKMLEVYNLNLKQIIECMEGDRIIDTRWFGK